MIPLPGDAVYCQELFVIDQQACSAMKDFPCPDCGSVLDIANIPRKLRDGPEGVTVRFGLCCRKDGCRARFWPPSVRFMGRKIYSALTLVLALDFHKSLGLAISPRTLARWRQFWKDRLTESSPFMRRARSRGLLQIPNVGSTPKAILAVFGFPDPASILPALKFFTQSS